MRVHVPTVAVTDVNVTGRLGSSISTTPFAGPVPRFETVAVHVIGSSSPTVRLSTRLTTSSSGYGHSAGLSATANVARPDELPAGASLTPAGTVVTTLALLEAA